MGNLIVDKLDAIPFQHEIECRNSDCLASADCKVWNRFINPVKGTRWPRLHLGQVDNAPAGSARVKVLCEDYVNAKSEEVLYGHRKSKEVPGADPESETPGT